MNNSHVTNKRMTDYIYQSLKIPVLVFDEDSNLCHANGEAKELLNICEEEFDEINKAGFYQTIFHTSVEEMVPDIKVPSSLDFDDPRYDTHLNFNISPMYDDDSNYIGYVVLVTDITEQIQNMQIAEQAKIEAQLANETSNLKSDFLANMSHEIRTPMNAIIGMAEMALRTELTNEAKDYISQIKSSGNSLLNIINDILDFSKIESGKLELIPDEYEILSNVHDVSTIVATRLKDKDVELIIAMNPNMPAKMYGDNLRIRQILINLANNAAKFTNHGYVRIEVDYDAIDEETAMVKFAVQDTGIGITEENINKLFESFQQVDSKRNRSVEGTGLGLAICKRLVELMDGEISVKSEYEKGSEFSFCIKQKVVDWSPSVEVRDTDDKVVFGLFRNKSIAKQFYTDLRLLSVDSIALSSMQIFSEVREQNKSELRGKQLFFYTEDKIYDEELIEFADNHPEIQFVVLRSFFSSSKTDKKNVMFIRKPLSTISLAMTLNRDESMIHRDEMSMDFDFVAPDAKVLIVDDNEVNLSVSEGLLKPINMQITTANSAIKALSYIDVERFDLVFMDHMMPEIDGIEATRIIRRLHPDLADMPIIALTANAVGDAKIMFLEEGMDDFVAKPIEVRTLVSKVKQWLPKEKIQKASGRVDKQQSDDIPVIGDLDVKAALSLIGSIDIYWTILTKYYESIKTKAEIIKKSEETEDLSTYTIEVHALKSSSKQIGAMSLSDRAAQLEKAGNEGNLSLIHEKTDEMLERYLKYENIIKPFIRVEEAQEKIQLDTEELKSLFEKLHAACEELDMDAMEETSKEIGKFDFDEEFSALYEQIKESVANLDSFTCEDVLNEWEAKL